MRIERSKPSGVSWKPHNYQKKAMRFLLEHAAGALFLDPGLGKTSISLGVIKVLLAKGLLGKVLVIAPLRVAQTTWPGQVEYWADFRGLRVAVLHGRDRERLLASDADIYVINPEGLAWLLQAKTVKTKTRDGRELVSIDFDLQRFKQFGFDTLIIDELSKFKNTRSLRFKLLKAIHRTFARRWGLTGSPAANGLEGLFGQCYILDEGAALGKFITQYRQRYFLPHPSGFGWQLREGAESEIYQALAPLALRMAAEDYLDLPVVVPDPIYLDLPPDARRAYDELEKKLVTTIDDKKVTAASRGVALNKCRQLASGAIYLTPDVMGLVKASRSQREWASVHDVKLDALEDLIEELQGQPLLVAYGFGHDLEKLRHRFPQAAVLADMKKAVDLRRLIERWNAGEVPVLILHPLAGAHGLDGLQHAGCHIVWYSLTDDYELYDQLIRRLRRQGSTHAHVFNHQLLMRDTVDDLVLRPMMEQKGQTQATLFEALQELARRRRNKK